MNQMRVVVVEDDAALRESLSAWLSKEYLVIGYESAESLINAIDNFEFEDGIATCILLDFQMPGMNGVELQSQLKEMSIEYPIIFMSGNAQQGDIIDAWHGGAIDFLLKPFSTTKLNEALFALAKKANAFKSSLPITTQKQEIKEIPISQREAEVLLLLGKGHRQNEIANILNITLRTIKWHRSNIKSKLNLNSPVELARFCDEYRLSIERIAKK